MSGVIWAAQGVCICADGKITRLMRGRPAGVTTCECGTEWRGASTAPPADARASDPARDVPSAVIELRDGTLYCPTCQGRNRATTDMVCMTCGRDYMPDDGTDVSEPGLGWKRLMGLWREQSKQTEATLARVEALAGEYEARAHVQTSRGAAAADIRARIGGES
jgi:hypothetical protein